MESFASYLDSYFALTERGTTIATEFRAGTASFLTLSYLLLVNPQIMAQAGVTHDDAVTATALSAGVSSIFVGVMGNLPFGCAPGLGLSAYLTYGLVQAGVCSLPEALTICWWSGIAVAVVTLTGLSGLLMRVVPEAIKFAIVVGMGLLIAMIGMVSVNLIVPSPKTLVELGDVGGDLSLQICLAGILFVASLLYHDTKGAILIGIAVVTLVEWVLNNSWPDRIFDIPDVNLDNGYWHPFSVFQTVNPSVLFPAVGSFVLICIFDISGVMFGLSTLGGIIKEDGEIPGSIWAFLASSVGTVIAAWTGSTPIIVCVECASGVKEGGRTGLTAVFIGLYFLSCGIFLAPLFSAVPETATAPVLVLVGVMMMGESAKIKWENMADALPAFLTLSLMPLTYSITNGMIFGLISSFGFYLTTGQFFSDSAKFHKQVSESICGVEGHREDEALVGEKKSLEFEYGSV